MKKRLLYIALIVICFGANIAVDRVTKVVAQNELRGNPSRSYLGNTVVLTYVENKGAFLGAFSNMPKHMRFVILVILPIIAVVGVFGYIIFNYKMPFSQRITLSVVLGGGAGNLIDRVLYGQVVDFLNFGIGNIRTGVLNVADMSVTFGIIGLMILILFFDKKKKHASNEEADLVVDEKAEKAEIADSEKSE